MRLPCSTRPAVGSLHNSSINDSMGLPIVLFTQHSPVLTVCYTQCMCQDLRPPPPYQAKAPRAVPEMKHQQLCWFCNQEASSLRKSQTMTTQNCEAIIINLTFRFCINVQDFESRRLCLLFWQITILQLIKYCHFFRARVSLILLGQTHVCRIRLQSSSWDVLLASLYSPSTTLRQWVSNLGGILTSPLPAHSATGKRGSCKGNVFATPSTAHNLLNMSTVFHNDQSEKHRETSKHQQPKVFISSSVSRFP